MPNVSSVFTSVASEYRAGGSVKCCCGFCCVQETVCPCVSFGNSFSLICCGKSFSQPSKDTVWPVARKRYCFASISAVVAFSCAVAICVATARHQIKLYSLYCCGVRCVLSDSGVRKTSVGRTASCASCAPFARLVNRRGFSSAYCDPNVATIYCCASPKNFSERFVESV